MKTVLVGFQCDPALKAELVRAAGASGLSQFLRSALADALRRDGFAVPAALERAPSRLGKGGPRKKRLATYIAPAAQAMRVNEP